MPRGITAGPDGNLWFTNYGSSTIGRITPAGVVSSFASPGSISGPSGITAGPDGNLWFTNEWGYSIGRISTTGSTWTFTGTGVSQPLGIAAGPDGNLWFTNDDSIGRITTGGVVTEFTDQYLDRPVGIAAGADGNLWFANAIDSIGRIVPAAGDWYHPLPTPTRILDSRPPPEQVGVFGAPWGAGESRQVVVAGVGGVPAEATAVALNVTVTGTTAASFLAIWPQGAPAQPTASNLNWSPAQTIANAVTVKAGDSGRVWVFNNAGAAHVIFDVVGWYDQSGTGAGFTAQAPVRVLDSRPPPEQVGPYALPWGAGIDRDVTVTGGSTGVPADAEAVVANVTVTGTTAESFLTVYPNGAVRPTASSSNWKAG
ncbi:MAG: hypothetical protein R2726_05255 [Acidimicrobiales bacterium]